VEEHEAALQHVNRAWDWFAGMVCISATNLGIELGLFDTIRSRGAASAAELANALNFQVRPIDTWAKTLIHYGLLEPAGDERVRLAPGVDLMVCEPRTLLNLAPSFAYHGRFLARDFLDLPALFREGKIEPPARHGRDLALNVAEQTAAMQAVFMTAILPDLGGVRELLEAGGAVLDAGCGTASLGVRLVSEYTTVTYTGVDTDTEALAAGREMIARLGLQGRLRLIEGNIAEHAEPAAYDLALLFLSLHEIGMDDRPAVARALRGALRPGGVLVILDERYPATLAEAALRSARSGLHFEYTEMLWGSRVPTSAEMDDLLTESGFREVEHRSALEGALDIILGWSR
jgi:SAM-dependent methyltransferase